ncbi:MAG: hypothetical protein HOU01_01735 [Streptomycetaceae bacterium]|nr:hypothetical protein [Streptomycetaceae bacterium]
MTFVRRGVRASWGRRIARLLFVTVWVGLLGTAMVTPAHAESCSSDKARNDPTSFWVPQDITGENWRVYCATGDQTGAHDRFGGKDMNGGDRGITRSQPSLKEYGAKHLTLGGAPDFSGLGQEPCEVFHPDVNGGQKVDFWAQCAKITGQDRGARYKDRDLKKEYGYPHTKKDGDEKTYEQYWQNQIQDKGVRLCDQWHNVFQLLGKKEPADLQARINTCWSDGDNALFQLKFSNPRIDTNTYDVHDYSAPKEMVDQLNQFLATGMWIGLFISSLGIVICGGAIANAHRNGLEIAFSIKWVMLGSVIILSANGITLVFLN